MNAPDAPLVFRDVGHVAGGRRVLDRVTLVVSAGDRTAVVGANGSGKSIIARLAIGLAAPVSGRVSLFGADLAVASARAARRLRGRVGLVLQGGSLLSELTVEENLRLGVGATTRRGLARLRPRIDRILLAFSLEGVSLRLVEALSTGERRRLELARAFLRDPDLLILDDPFEGLDAAAAAELERRVLALLGRHSCACLILTGDGALARRMAARVLTLAGGVLTD